MTLPDQTPTEPGIYFGLPFDTYCKIQAINAGGIKRLLVSCMDYWAETPMNPVYHLINTDTQAKEDGRIFHKRILEGRTAFYQQYAPDYEDDKDPAVLRTVDDIKSRLLKLGAPVTFKTKAEGAARLVKLEPKARILHVEEYQHRAQYPGREFVSQALIREVELNAKVIDFHPQLQHHFTGGYPEVTVIWFDEELGVLCKIRFDYLKRDYGSDLKTYANQMGKNIARAIATDFARFRYHIQGSLYLRGHYAAKVLAAEGRAFGEYDKKWLQKFKEYDPEGFRFIFLKKGHAPVASGRLYHLGRKADTQALSLIREAVNLYHRCMRDFGTTRPWIDLSPEQDIDFDEIPAYVNDL